MTARLYRLVVCFHYSLLITPNDAVCFIKCSVDLLAALIFVCVVELAEAEYASVIRCTAPEHCILWAYIGLHYVFLY